MRVATGSIRQKRTLDEKTGNWVLVTLYFVNGVEVTKREFDRCFPDRARELSRTERRRMAKAGAARWPLKSTAMAVHPEQVEEANEHLKKNGCASRHDADGRLVIPDGGDRKRVMRLRNALDRDSFN
jgi:hypothetical protein